MLTISSTISRVRDNTAEEVNRRIDDETARRVTGCAASGPEAVDRRLAELDEEWDIERLIGTAAPVGILVGLTLGLTVSRRFLVLPVAVASFLLLHGIQGWAPPLPVMRRLGFRTTEEIDEERYALRAVRGDFREISEGALPSLTAEVARLMEAVRH